MEQELQEEKKLYRVRDLMKMSGKSLVTIYTYIKEGLIPVTLRAPATRIYKPKGEKIYYYWNEEDFKKAVKILKRGKIKTKRLKISLE